MFESVTTAGTTVPYSRLLQNLPPDDLARLEQGGARIALQLGERLAWPNEPVEFVYFPLAGTVSMINTMEDGARIEVGLVGREGMVGLSVLLGAPTSSLEGLVQVGGSALRLPAARFRAALAELPALQPLLLRYTDSFHFQVAQTAACNGRHAIEQRLARWLLMEHDRSDSDTFDMTQEFLSIMLGVRRPGVTIAVGALQRAGLVQHSRGTMRILNRPGLEAASCECHKVVQRRFAWINQVNGH